MPAPDHDAAMDAMNAVQQMTTEQFNSTISAEVGDNLLGVFYALARSQEPDADNEALARRVHLMVVSYLMRVQLEK